MRLIGDFLCLLLSVYIRFLYFGHRVSQNRGQATKRKWEGGGCPPLFSCCRECWAMVAFLGVDKARVFKRTSYSARLILFPGELTASSIPAVRSQLL